MRRHVLTDLPVFVRLSGAEALRARAQVQLSGPFSRTALTTSASYEIRSPKRLQVRRLCHLSLCFDRQRVWHGSSQATTGTPPTPLHWILSV